MNIETSQETAATQSTIGGLPEITSAEELDKLLNQNGEGGEEPEKKVKPTQAKPAAATSAEGGEEEEEEEEGDENDEGKEENKKYPSILHALRDEHGLELNLNDDELPTIEEQTEVVSEIITRMTEGVNNALAQYRHIDELLKDPEVKRVLEAKAQNKTLKDIAAEFIQTPQGMDDDNLVANQFKKLNPKATPEVITSMVESLKKNGQFAAFAAGLREQSAEEQSLAEQRAQEQRQREEQARQQKDQQELQEYVQFVGSQTHVYGVPLTDHMKQQVLQFTTVRDEEGMTQLDHALQSNEGTVLATLGIAFMQELMKNGASAEGNRKNAKFINKVFQRPDALQSGGNGVKKDEFDPALANLF